MDLHDTVRLLKRSLSLILLLAVLGAVAGYAGGLLQRPVYQAVSKAFVSTRSADSITDLSTGASFTAQAVKSYADIATTAYVLRPVIRQLDLDTTPAELAGRVDVTATEGEAVLEVVVTDRSPVRSARIADAVTRQLASAVVTLTPDGSAKTPSSTIKLTPVDPAVVPTTAAGFGPVVRGAVGALLGALLAVLIGLLRHLLDTRIRSVEDLAAVSRVPLLGRTTRDPRARRHPLTIQDRAGSVRAEAYRTLRTNLSFVEMEPDARSVVITSALENEGKSTTAANLALAVAHLGERVLLVDADLRRPSVAGLFGVDGTLGLTDVLVGTVRLEDAVQRSESGGLDLLPAGTIPPNPNELLQGRAIGPLLERLHVDYDLVVFDAPPLLAVSDAAVLSARTGGTIVVAAAGRVRRPQLSAALEALDRANARVLGFVLTMLPRRSQDAPAYGYGHGEQRTSRKGGRGPATAPATSTVLRAGTDVDAGSDPRTDAAPVSRADGDRRPETNPGIRSVRLPDSTATFAAHEQSGPTGLQRQHGRATLPVRLVPPAGFPSRTGRRF